MARWLAIYDIAWQPQTETWQLVHTEGRIPPGIPEVPEPMTLLLWGTGAARLGLVRWLRRRLVANSDLSP